MSNNSGNANETNGNKCPHITDPYLECYGIGFDSENTQKAVKYCLGDYTNCEIYIKHRKTQETEQIIFD
jgi:hypothetical protein